MERRGAVRSRECLVRHRLIRLNRTDSIEAPGVRSVCLVPADVRGQVFQRKAHVRQVLHDKIWNDRSEYV